MQLRAIQRRIVAALAALALLAAPLSALAAPTCAASRSPHEPGTCCCKLHASGTDGGCCCSLRKSVDAAACPVKASQPRSCCAAKQQVAASESHEPAEFTATAHDVDDANGCQCGAAAEKQLAAWHDSGRKPWPRDVATAATALTSVVIDSFVSLNRIEQDVSIGVVDSQRARAQLGNWLI